VTGGKRIINVLYRKYVSNGTGREFGPDAAYISFMAMIWCKKIAEYSREGQT
jgi:hypothetical protein